MMYGQNTPDRGRIHPEDSFETFGGGLVHIPFLISSPPISPFFDIFSYYVITAHAVGHDVIGHPDIRNKSPRVDKPGPEVRFTLPGTDEKLRPVRYALISYFGLMLRKFCCR